MNPTSVYSRTVISWELAFVHAGKTLHHLKSALLMTLASAGLGLAWLCCWFDRFLSGKRAGAWIISPRPSPRPAPEPQRPIAVAERMPPLAFDRSHPRTIDGLLQHKGRGQRVHEAGNAPFLN